MKTTVPLPKTRLPVSPELALKAPEGPPCNGEDGPPAEAPATADQLRADQTPPNARYAGGNMYDFINAQITL